MSLYQKFYYPFKAQLQKPNTTRNPKYPGLFLLFTENHQVLISIQVVGLKKVLGLLLGADNSEDLLQLLWDPPGLFTRPRLPSSGLLPPKSEAPGSW